MSQNTQNGYKVNIVGAGLAGLSAALELSKAGIASRLISVQTSERAQSNLAEGGINACMNVMGENDHTYEHFMDTLKGGCYLADPNMAAGLCLAAPGIIRDLISIGVPFQRENGKLIQRNFGGQKKKRTAYVKSSTGRMIMSAMIDAVRKYECEGLVERLAHHEFLELNIEEGKCRGLFVRDQYLGEIVYLEGAVIMAAGGMNGLFRGKTTGSTANTGDAAAVLFAQGVEMANLEMIQYHPTTVQISGKRMLISEAARGEGGRLFYYGGADKKDKIYFMENKYGERGNLMPRDIVSREMAACGNQVYLDLTPVTAETWGRKLSDMREEIMHYLAADPVTTPVPVAPGIHFFMGGIRIDEAHRTNIPGLYAAGECACGYHGANRLGGNSLLGAVYGGRIAARTVTACRIENGSERSLKPSKGVKSSLVFDHGEYFNCSGCDGTEEKISSILTVNMPVLRTRTGLEGGLSEIRRLMEISNNSKSVTYCRLLLAEAFLLSAVSRRESRGAHYVSEYPETEDDFRKISIAHSTGEDVSIRFAEIPGLRDDMRTALHL